MKKILVAVVILFPFFIANAQNWKRTSVGNNVSVMFPLEAKYELKSNNGKQVGTYLSISQSCLFMAMVSYDMIPNYPEFVNLKQEEQEVFIGTLLDNVAKGKLLYSNTKTNVDRFTINGCQARRVAYSGVNPQTGKEAKRYSTMFMVSNKVFTFDCWFLNSEPQGQNEKNTFFNSIRIN